MDDLKPIRVFLAVARHLSFAKAAQATGLTPASVTRIVAALERKLDQQLFVRTTRQVSLTSAGAMVAARFEPVVAEFDKARDDVIRATRPDLGRLRINAPQSFGLRLLPGMIEAFRLVYPNIEVEVHLTDQLIDIIEERCDLAIRISRPPADKSTIWRKLCEVPRYLIAAPALFERTPRPGQPEDLDPRDLLSYSASGAAEMWELRKGAQVRTVRAGHAVLSNNGDFLYDVTRAGGGMCVLPDFIVRDGLASGAVERVLPEWSLTPLWLTLYYPPYEQLPPIVATFNDFFEAYIRDIDGLEF